MFIRPGFEVYWRRPGESQVGLDPRCALLLTDLQPAEQRLLDRLPAASSPEELYWRGEELGLGRDQVQDLLDRLRDSGYLVADTPGQSSARRTESARDPSTVYWHRAAVAGRPRAADRAESLIEVRGLGELGLRTACILAEAGVGTVAVSDRRRVRSEDVGGGLYRPGDVGRVREDSALSVLRSVEPMVRTAAGPDVRPDLVIVVENGVVDPVRIRPLVREDILHLPVLIRELDVVIGPLVRPGLGVCLRCLDLHRCDRDPRWPAVATQVATCPPQGVEASLGWLAASFAAHQALAVADVRRTVLDGTSAEVNGWDPVPVLRRWSAHPDCGCSPATFEVPATADPATADPATDEPATSAGSAPGLQTDRTPAAEAVTTD